MNSHGLPYRQNLWHLHGCALGIGFAVAMTTPFSVRAQSVETPQALSAEGLRRQEERAREQRQAAEPRADVLAPAKPLSKLLRLPVELPCSVITAIRLEGPDATRLTWLVKAAAPYLMQCAGVDGLNIILSALNDELVSQGLVTSKVTLAPQNLGAGILHVRLHAGRIEGVRFEDKGADWGTWRNAFLPMTGDVLNVRSLEQGVEQMKRLPSQDVSTRIEPGEAPDTSVVVIERTQGTLADRVRGGVTLDNSGNQTLGRPQLSANLALDNPLGLSDIINAGLSSNLQGLSSQHRSQSINLSYSVPVGYSLFSLNASTSQFAQRVQLTTQDVLSSGSSSSVEARWQHTWLRTSSGKFGTYVAASTRKAHSYIDDLELLVQRRRTSFLETGISYKQLFENTSVDIDTGVRRGGGWNQAQEDFAANPDGLTLRPKIWTFNASVNRALAFADRRWTASSSLRAQHTQNATTSIDQLSIGGRGSVRGFDGEAVLLAESGYVLRNEINTPVKLVEGIDTQFMAALDVGRVFGPSDVNLVGRKLAGVAIGVRGATRRFQFEALLATPLYRPEAFRSRKLNPYLSLTYAF